MKVVAGDPNGAGRAALIANERAKLTATYFNGMAVAVFAVGGLAPIFSVLFSSATSAAPTWIVPLSSIVCWIVSAGLHSAGRSFLGKLAQ